MTDTHARRGFISDAKRFRINFGFNVSVFAFTFSVAVTRRRCQAEAFTIGATSGDPNEKASCIVNAPVVAHACRNAATLESCVARGTALVECGSRHHRTRKPPEWLPRCSIRTSWRLMKSVKTTACIGHKP